MLHGIDPTRVRAAVFDLGGVFLAGGVESVRAFGEQHGLTRETWAALRHELFADDGPWAEVERGALPYSDFVTLLRERIVAAGGAVSLDDADAFMGRRDSGSTDQRLRTEIVDAAARVHARMPTALLTNNVAEWRDHWRTAIDVDALFDVVIDSSAVGTRKPEPRIYDLTRARLAVPHEALFFVDDLGVNLKPARALGWQTLKYEDTAVVLEVLEALATHGQSR